MPAVPIQEIVALVEGEYSGDPARLIAGVRPLADAGREDLTLLAGERYEPLLSESGAGAILVPRELAREDAERFIRVADPHAALARVLQRWFAEVPHPPVGISPRAEVSSTAVVGEGSRIGANVVIGDRALIGRDVTIYPGTYVGADCVIGDQTVLYANVTLYHRCSVGRHCIIHSAAVIGADGYGFVTTGGVHQKIPQVGIVRIEDHVEIGAGTTIDRATLGETVIGEGTKIDNLVQIGHNVRVGRHCLLVAQAAIAGSTEIGDSAVFGGQAGAAGHLRIARGVKVSAKAAVMKDVDEENMMLGGFPARPLQEHLRSEALIRRLPQIVERLEKLEQEARKRG